MLIRTRLILSTLALGLSTLAYATEVGTDSDAAQAPIVEVTGKLVLKGTAQFPVPAIVTDRGTWALKGIPKAQAESLQGEVVTVRGHALPGVSAPSMLPALSVDTLQSESR